MDIKLINGNRYLFHNQQEKHNFRADFIDIITRNDGYKTLRVEKYDSDSQLVSRTVTLPFSWIIKIETLVDIVNNACSDDIGHKITHIDDVLLEIDSFL